MIVYGGRSYQNNSIVNLDAEGGILQCFTNKSGCCSVVPNRTGEWIYPNGSMVQIYGYNRNFYRTRGADPGVVNLVWTKNSILPTGLLCCKILNQKACIGMYPEEEGRLVTNTVMLQLDSNSYCVGCVYRYSQGN